MQTRAVLAEVDRLVPGARVRDVDVVRNEEEAVRMRIRSTPTIVVRADDGTDVFRAEGVPTLTQLLAAAAKAL
jgi:protein-disulfide isomerase